MRKSLTLTLVLGMFLWILPIGSVSAQGTDHPLVFHSLDAPCVVFDTRPAPTGSGDGPLVSEGATDAMAFDIVGTGIGGPPDNFESQGGTPGGCGIPGFISGNPVTVAVLMNLVAINPSAGGNLRAYPTGSAGSGGIVNFQALTPNLNNSNAFTLPVRQDTQGQDITIEINGAPGSTVHVRGIILGYFTPASHRVEHIVGGSGEFRNNVIGGSYDLNIVAAGQIGATISGGGGDAADFGEAPAPKPNQVFGNFGTIGGGWGNTAGGNADFGYPSATVAGGDSNSAGSSWATVGGGYSNDAALAAATVAGGYNNAASGDTSTVGGGGANEAGGNWATVAGGNSNAAQGNYSAIGGGDDNTADAANSTVGGGELNTAGASWATIAGGQGNDASGQHATVGGGSSGSAGGDYATVSGGLLNVTPSRLATVAGGEQNNASGEAAAIGGGYYNHALALHATIAGGGPSDLTVDHSLTNNRVYDNYGTIGGGGYNRVGSDDADPTTATYATVGGGIGNRAAGIAAAVGGGSHNDARADYATIGGGGPSELNNPLFTNNRVFDDYGTIGGGGGNVAGSDDAEDTGMYSTVSGGFLNGATGTAATVGGGYWNAATGSFSTVGGGGGPFSSNSATGSGATVSGGTSNQALAIGAMVPGGHANEASGDYSFAAGYYASADHDHSFVWNGTGTTLAESDRVGQFKILAPGGVWIEADSHGLDPVALFVQASSTTDGIAVYGRAASTDTVFLSKNAGEGDLYQGLSSTNATRFRVDNDGDVFAKSYTPPSDRNVKENFSSIDPTAILHALAELPIETWNYIGDDPGAGTWVQVAQDFAATFELGDSEVGFTTIDADGVALAAIQGLYAQNQALQAQVDAIQAPADGATGVSVTLLMLLVLGAAVVTGSVVEVVTRKR